MAFLDLLLMIGAIHYFMTYFRNDDESDSRMVENKIIYIIWSLNKSRRLSEGNSWAYTLPTIHLLQAQASRTVSWRISWTTWFNNTTPQDEKNYTPLKFNIYSPWKTVVGRLLSYWEGNFSEATSNFERVDLRALNFETPLWAHGEISLQQGFVLEKRTFQQTKYYAVFVGSFL